MTEQRQSDSSSDSSRPASEVKEKELIFANPAVCTLKVAGQEIKHSINSVELRQFIDDHHVLKVSLFYGNVSEASLGDIGPYTDFLGESLSFGIKPEGSRISDDLTLEFIGIVTEIRFENSYNDFNILKITAHSPTIQMDGATKNSFSYEQKASDIVGGILSHYRISQGSIETTKETLPFSVQYRETDYEYIMRLAASNGKFAFYDGKEFRFVKASSTDEQELIFMETLGSFSLGLGTVSSNYEADVYNYEEGKIISQNSSSISSKASLSALSEKSASISEDIYRDSGYSEDAQIVSDNKALDSILENERSRARGKMVKCYGHSIAPSVSVGHCVKVGNMGDLNQQYWVTRVTHIFDKTGEYHNKFECTPIDIAYPTNCATISSSHTQAQTAVVTDNADPDKMGRIKVKFPWSKSDETVWIRFVSPHAGQQRGWYALPEIDDEVLVIFERGNPDIPVAIGSLYNKTQIPHADSQAEDNNVKMYTTKSGNQIKFTDQSGEEKIEISQGDGANSIVLDLGGRAISIKSDGDITIEGNSITLTAENDIILDAGTEAKVEAGSNMNLKAGANQTVEGGGKVDIKGATINLN